MKKYLRIASAGAAAAAAAMGAAGYAVSSKIAASVMQGRRQTYEESYAWQKERYDTSFFEPLEKEEYTVTAEDGYILHALLCLNPEPTDRCMILTHGHSDNRMGSLKYMKLYLDLGFHCLIYDLRGHGGNAPCDCSYGILESRDLLAVLADAKERFPEMKSFALHGESLGSATVITALGAHPDVAFAVADCGFADLENVLYGLMRHMHLPRFLVQAASRLSKQKYGYSFEEMRPVDHLADNEVPILFIHGGDDLFITLDNSDRMHHATKGYSELVIVPDAEHAKSILTDPELYRDSVEHFLEQISVIKRQREPGHESDPGTDQEADQSAWL